MAREMKDSGIEWIGEVPTHWELSRAKNHFVQSFLKGNKELVLLSATQNEGVIPKNRLDGVVQVKEDTDLSTFKTVHYGDYVISLRSFQGGFEMSEHEGVITPAYTVFRNRNVIDNGYFKRLFKSDGFIAKINSLTVGIREGKNIMFSDFANSIIPVPPLEEQARIANFLDSKCSKIDETIEKEKEVIEKLKAYKQSVITEAVTQGLTPEVPMKDSGIEWIGEIPDHWKVVKMNSIFTFLGGFAFSSDKYTDETNNQVIRIGNVKSDNLVLDTNPVYISDEYSMAALSSEIKVEDILFTMTGTKGKRDYFYTLLIEKEQLNGKKLFLNQRVGCLRNRGNVYPRYYTYLLKNERILDSIFIYETGTANQGNLGMEIIKRTKLHFPPLKEQVEIVAYLNRCCSNIDDIIMRKQQVIDKLVEYKKSLIYECVTGKREV
ncbi:restriction endonuclease subunit S [Bacillus mycoides]|uniref:restriction endonuclease subunit S n=1 Tax=Bacillus mycoides TaxID=1405 RepID=UPI003D222169